jgi:hypothetical protein
MPGMCAEDSFPGSSHCLNGSEGQDLARVRALVPPLTYAAYKGQMGRVAVLGGESLSKGYRLRTLKIDSGGVLF